MSLYYSADIIFMRVIMVYNLKMQCFKECPTHKNCNAKAW